MFHLFGVCSSYLENGLNFLEWVLKRLIFDRFWQTNNAHTILTVFDSKEQKTIFDKMIASDEVR